MCFSAEPSASEGIELIGRPANSSPQHATTTTLQQQPKSSGGTMHASTQAALLQQNGTDVALNAPNYNNPSQPSTPATSQETSQPKVSLLKRYDTLSLNGKRKSSTITASTSNEDIDKKVLQRGFISMAGYLNQRKESITIIVIGAVVSTMLLRERETISICDGVEFCANDLDVRQRGLLYDAARHAAETVRGLGGVDGWGADEKVNWFNVERSERKGAKGVKVKTMQKIVENALLQNDVVFQLPGLKILAAPWSYAFLLMLARISSYSSQPGPNPSDNVFIRPDGTIVHPDGTRIKPDPKSRPPPKKLQGPQESQDLSDAVSFLNEYIGRHEKKPVSMRRIIGWGHDYRIKLDPALLRRVEEEYKRRYKTDGIVQRSLNP